MYPLLITTPRLGSPVDKANRKVKKQVDNAGFAAVSCTDELAKRYGNLRPDTFEAGYRAKQRIENFRPHCAFKYR